MKRKSYSPKITSSTIKRDAFTIKCIYNTLVNVNNAPSGKKYTFQPGEQRTITDKQDYDYLLSLNKKSGCCGGSGQQVKRYFEAV